MTPEELLNAVGQVDDDLVAEAEEYRPRRAEGGLSRWRPLAGGLAAACLVAAALFHLPAGTGSSGSSAGAGTASSSDSTGGGSGNGQGSSSAGAGESQAAEPDRLHTPAGTYVLTGEIVSQLPQDSRQLGVLFYQGEESQSQLYTGRREYAGCMLWEGPEGELYVQLPGGGYAAARMED